MLEAELRHSISPDPEFLHRLLESQDSVIDPETGIIIEESTLIELEQVSRL